MRQLEGFLVGAVNFRYEILCKAEDGQTLTVFWDCPPDRLHEMKLNSPTKVLVTFAGNTNSVDDVKVVPL